jgi:hypothetical protein
MNRRDLLGAVGATWLLPAIAAPVVDPVSPAFQAALRLGPPQAGSGNHRFADIVGGRFSGRRLSGRVQSGRLDWFIDPASGAVEVAVSCSVVRADGVTTQMRDRTARVPAYTGATLAGHPTAPVLDGAIGEAGLPLLVGRLDTTAIWRGFISLRAFEVV